MTNHLLCFVIEHYCFYYDKLTIKFLLIPLLGIVKYMKAQVGPSSKELKTTECLEKFLAAEKDTTVVGFFEKESDLKAAFLKLADKLREKVRFAHTTFMELLDKQGVK